MQYLFKKDFNLLTKSTFAKEKEMAMYSGASWMSVLILCLNNVSSNVAAHVKKIQSAEKTGCQDCLIKFTPANCRQCVASAERRIALQIARITFSHACAVASKLIHTITRYPHRTWEMEKKIERKARDIKLIPLIVWLLCEASACTKAQSTNYVSC